MAEFWKKHHQNPELAGLADVWRRIYEQKDPRWDIGEGHREWPMRGYTVEEMEESVALYLREWIEVLKI